MSSTATRRSDGLVLIVEDDPDIAETIAETLIERGYRAETARNGAAALERLRVPPRPSLILLDLSMPVMNGWQFRQKQLAESELASIPVVVLTADAAAPGRADLGPIDWLLKPVGLSNLLDTVERYCRVSEAHV
jgi:CheY-like chemotaxis protein